ncbi:MAG: hypothetical protein XD78_1463 [Desulfotomaculum sp. 46_296]|nr:MAG: hypothetical protein XD78_1463 [Desulfotomaculum sp. 46_296]
MLTNNFGDRAAQAAYNAVLLGGDNGFCLLCGFNHSLSIQGFDCVHVDNPYLKPLVGKFAGRRQSLSHHQAGSYNGCRRTFPHCNRFAGFKNEIIFMKSGDSQPSQSQVYRPLDFNRFQNSFFGLRRVCRHDYGKIGQSSC